MKKLEKKELRSILGGYRYGCRDNKNGTSSCYVIYDNGWACSGMYNYDGTNYKGEEPHCFQLNLSA